MTVSSTTRKAGPFTGNGVTTAFPFTFKVFAKADIEITRTVTATGVQTVLVLDSDYSVTLNGDQDNNPGGTITYPLVGSPMPATQTLVGIGVLDYEQSTDISNLGNFLPQVFEDAFDYVHVLIQQLREWLTRAIVVPVGDTATDLTLPTVTNRANKTLAFDDDGNVQAVATATDAQAAVTLALTYRNDTLAARAAAEAAETASELAQAETEEARDIALAAVANTGEAVIDALIDDETSAIAISATADPDFAMKVVDAANPLNNLVGPITDFSTTFWTQPKLCTQTDRRTLKWSAHNFAKQTDSPGSNIMGASFVAADDSDGTQEAATLTATSAVQAAFRQLSLGSSTYNGMYHMIEWIVEAGTAAFGYVGYNDGSDKFAYFNASTWATATVHASITAAINNTRADGTALPSGYKRITAYFKTTTNSIDVYCGMCDADASKAVTLGRTFTGEKPFLHLGVQSLDYFENTTTAIKVGVPYDHVKGSARIPVDIAATYNGLWTDDLTQAPWVKSASMAAAFTATGPGGAPCSTLTSSAADQTCLQSIVSATATQIFTPYVKRRTGTGSIWLTADNGSTWTEITSQLNSSTYTRFAINGTTNPTIGFKITTSTDAIDVALANNANIGQSPMPLPVDGTARVSATDAFIVPTSLFTAGSAYTVYADFDRRPGTAFTDDVPIRISNVGFSQEVTLGVVGATGVGSMTVKDGSVTKTYPLWKYTNGERIELTAKVEDSEHVMSINGEPPGWVTTAGMPAITQVKLTNSGPMFLRRLLIVNRAVPRDDVRLWRYSAGVLNGLVGCEVAAWDRDADVANTTMNREPKLCIVSDDGAQADALTLWSQKHDTGHTGEAPMRLMQRKVRFSVDGSVSMLTEAAVIQQQAGWVLGEGHLQSPVAVRLPSYSTFPGRLVMLFTALENPDFSVDKRSVWVMTNDDTDDYAPTAWSAPTKIVSAAAAELWVVDPSGAFLILPPTHPVAPNRIIALYYWIGGFKSIYSDNWGVTWTSGTTCTPAVTTDETNLTLRPDGTLIATSRVNVASTSRRSWATSVDAGATWADQGMLTGYNYAACSNGIVQMDPTGMTGAYGKIALAHPVDSASRKGLQIDFATDAAMTFGSPIKPFDTGSVRYFGYSCLKSLFGGSHFALTVEYGSIPFNTDNSVAVAMIEAP